MDFLSSLGERVSVKRRTGEGVHSSPSYVRLCKHERSRQQLYGNAHRITSPASRRQSPPKADWPGDGFRARQDRNPWLQGTTLEGRCKVPPRF
jgi:hypothetical protein